LTLVVFHLKYCEEITQSNALLGYEHERTEEI
jgi:hypothetical protein